MYYINILNKILFFCLIIPICFAQEFTKNIHIQTEIGAYLSTYEQTPFWLRSSQYGIVPSSQSLTLRGSAYKNYDSIIKTENKLKRFSYGYGINSLINVGKVNQLILQEAYLKVRFGAFELYGGRRKEIVGLVDTMLTSGSYIWSGNALPMPKIQISIPNYKSIIGHGFISIKGSFAHGWFGNHGVVKDYYLHQKWLYGRVGKPNWKIKLYGGLNHQVQWGGRPNKPYIETKTGKLISSFGNDFNSYLKVVSGASLNAKGNGFDLSGIPLGEALNREGNHLGSVDIATEVNFKSFDLLIYRQNIFEDGSLFYLNNITDGLFGVSLSRKNIKKGILKVNFEYFNSLSQGGKSEDRFDDIPQLRGNDNYFNNGVYIDAWTYNNNVLGTPLITPINQINKALIRKYDFSTVPDTYIVNNRIEGYYLSFLSKIQAMNLTTKILWTTNLGLYEHPIFVNQFSFSQNINYQLPKYTLIGNISFDIGELYKKNSGCYLGIRRTFF